MSTEGSRLVQIRTRFQQRQLIEKEQKLTSMYENSQARVLSRLASQPQVPAPPAGKVRQMFEERRTKAGIDKSYPLQPLPGAPQAKATPHRLNGNANTLERNGVHDVTIKLKQTKIESMNDYKNYQTKDINENKAENLDALAKPIVNKLPNVGKLSGQKLVKPERNGQVKMVNNKVERELVEDAKNKNFASKKNLKSSSASPIDSNVSNSLSRVTTPPSPAKRISPTTPKTVNSAPSINMSTKTKAPPVKQALTKSDSREICNICNRQFAPDRIAKHAIICEKTASKKRKIYDSVKHRVAGTEVEAYVKPIRKAARPSVKSNNIATASASQSSKSNWRKQHEEFIAAIRAAKMAKEYVSKGGKLSDLPPPPPSDTSHYKMCPHCNRKFNEAAAQRHIPKCATFQFNKPKPNAGGKKR